MNRKCGLVVAAMGLCLGALPRVSSAMLVDVRVINASNYLWIHDSKTVNVYPATSGWVTVGIFLSGLSTEVGGTNGLGAFVASVRSLNDGPGGYAQATASSNSQSYSAFDFFYSDGTLADSTIAEDTDTDLDVLRISGVQIDFPPAYQPGIGSAAEIMLGSATFSFPANTGSFDLNTFYTGAASFTSSLGGLWIQTLTSTATDDTNGLNAGNLASAAVIGSPVHVVLPEPTSLCMIGIAASGLLRRRRSPHRARA